MYMCIDPIEYVSYRQGPYRIRIDLADDRIVPALQIMHLGSKIYTEY